MGSSLCTAMVLKNSPDAAELVARGLHDLVPVIRRHFDPDGDASISTRKGIQDVRMPDAALRGKSPHLRHRPASISVPRTRTTMTGRSSNWPPPIGGRASCQFRHGWAPNSPRSSGGVTTGIGMVGTSRRGEGSVPISTCMRTSSTRLAPFGSPTGKGCSRGGGSRVHACFIIAARGTWRSPCASWRGSKGNPTRSRGPFFRLPMVTL